MAPSSRAVSRVKRRKVVHMAKLLHPLNTMGWETTRGKGTGVYKGEAGREDRARFALPNVASGFSQTLREFRRRAARLRRQALQKQTRVAFFRQGRWSAGAKFLGDKGRARAKANATRCGKRGHPSCVRAGTEGGRYTLAADVDCAEA